MSKHRYPGQFINILERLGDRDLTATDIVTLTEPLRTVLTNAMRVGHVQLDDLASELGLSLRGASRVANLLVKKGMFHPTSETTFSVRVSGWTHRHEGPHTDDLWKKIDNADDSETL